jgi:hypothetical protein
MDTTHSPKVHLIAEDAASNRVLVHQVNSRRESV